MLAIGCGALVPVALLVPFFRPPLGGEYFVYWVCGATVLLGMVAALRGERGLLGLIAAIVSLTAGALAVFGILFAFGISLLIRLAMPD
jgi:hypothetical protein